MGFGECGTLGLKDFVFGQLTKCAVRGFSLDGISKLCTSF